VHHRILSGVLSRTLPILCAALALSTPARAQLNIPDVDVKTMVKDLGLVEADKPVRLRPDWKPLKKVVVMELDAPERLPWLQQVAPGVELVAATAKELPEKLKGADALIGRCEKNVVTGADSVRWMHVNGAGVERCIGDETFQSGRVLMTNMARLAAPMMAEHVIALMLTMTRGLPVFLDAQKREEFARPKNFAASLDAKKREEVIRRDDSDVPWMIRIDGRTMLIVGLGGVGTEVARRAHGLGMKVIATSNSSTEKPAFVDYVGKSDEVLALTAKADVIVNTLPLTDSTRHFLGKEFFARMKRDAYFINVGRGLTVDQDAMIAALNEERIAGAALDVMTPEPLPKGHPLWKAKNVVITPHISAVAGDRGERWLLAREQLRRYIAGEKMLSIVDPTLGY
jgi:phosphoglycerate dehydrogenase-like enzyme